MAKKYENSKNIAIIEMNLDEASNVGFGPICDYCNDVSLDKNSIRHYIPVLNKVFCKKCYEKWINNPSTKHYEEDIHYEKLHYNYYAEKLNIPTI